MKPHPVDERDAAWIAEAVEFTATVYYGRQHHTVRTATMAEAADAALALEAALRRGGVSKGVLVYAITDRGRSTLVPDSQWRGLATPGTEPQVENTPDDCAGASQEPTMQTYSTKSNAKKAAKKAGHPDAFISYNPKLDRWHWDTREPQERKDDALDALARAGIAGPADVSLEAEPPTEEGYFHSVDEVLAACKAAGTGDPELIVDMPNGLIWAGDENMAPPRVLAEWKKRQLLDAANREAIATTEKGEPIPAFLKREHADRAAVLAHAKPADGWDKLAESPEGKANAATWEKANGGPVKPTRKAKVTAAKAGEALAQRPQAAPAPKRVGKALAQHEAAKRGIMPPVPALESAAHKGYWKHRDAIAKLAAERNVDALRAYPIEPKCSSRIPLVRFIEDTLIALEAGA